MASAVTVATDLDQPSERHIGDDRIAGQRVELETQLSAVVASVRIPKLTGKVRPLVGNCCSILFRV